MRQLLIILAVAISVVTILSTASIPAAVGPDVSQRLYVYDYATDKQVTIPCGSSTHVGELYWETSVADIGAFSYSLGAIVDTPSVPAIWRKTLGDTALRTSVGEVPRRMDTFTQKLAGAGVWTFTALVAGRPATAVRCSITKL